MHLFDLIKATVFCGLLAFLVYSFPVIGQVLLIGLMSVLWLSCAMQTIKTVRRKSSLG